MKVPANTSSIKNKLSLTLALWLGLAAISGLAGCSKHHSSEPTPPTVSVTDASITEGDSNSTDLEFTITVNKASNSKITVTYELSNGTAVAGDDYDGTPGSVDIPVGQTSVPILVPVTGDNDIEADETFTLTLTVASGATLGTTSATGTITNDDHADPSAYYIGSATIKDPDDITSDIVLSDLKVMVSGNRMIMMSMTWFILYDAQITSISGNDFTADVTVYTGLGLNPYSPDFDVIPAPVLTSITGTILEGSSIQGTIAGTGSATGVFTANFDNMSGTTADSTNIAKTWEGHLNERSDAYIKLTLDSSGLLTVAFGDYPHYGIFSNCRHSGTITPINLESIYLVDLDLANCGQDSTSGKYTGLAIPASLSYGTLIFTFSDGNLAGFAELTVAP